MKKRQAADLEVRKARLAQLLAAEDRIYEQEFNDNMETPEQVRELIGVAANDARLLLERDGGLDGPRGQAARVALYLFERDAGVATLRGG